MIYEIPEYKLAMMLEKAAEAGANRVLVEQGMKKSQVSQSEAYRRYGQTNVCRWRRDGKVVPHKIGGIIYYSTAKLETLKQSNYLIYGPRDDESGNPSLDVQRAIASKSRNTSENGEGDAQKSSKSGRRKKTLPTT